MAGIPKEKCKGRFENVRVELEYKGMDVIDPYLLDEILPEGLTREELLQIDLALLDVCDTICMLNGWENSLGANMELGYALGRGKELMYEGEVRE
jgi:nucleoside 2-deoxyribosyltransferase